MVMAPISGGSVSKGPSEGLRMPEKESTEDDLGREDGVRSKEMGLHCTADQAGSVQVFFQIFIAV